MHGQPMFLTIWLGMLTIPFLAGLRKRQTMPNIRLRTALLFLGWSCTGILWIAR